MQRTIKNLDELENFAREVLAELSAKEDKATVVGLSGELGSGKTAFVKVLAKALGAKEEVLSPTFVIAKFYPIFEDPRWKTLIHIDLYRIEEQGELKVLRYAEILADPTNLVVIEWPERTEELFPEDAPVLRFRFVDETTRIVSA